MAIRKIRKFGDNVLKQKTKKVGNIDEQIQELVKDLFHTMYNAPGVGLAANQIGVPLQVAVIDVMPEGRSKPMVFINPVIKEKYGNICEEEGCLSVPGIFAKVKRSAKVKIWALDENGREFTITLDGISARAIEHEIDHLNGVVFVDRLTPLKKIKARLMIRKLKRHGQWK
ncbi:MAG: peptide deformylase [bacterium]